MSGIRKNSEVFHSMTVAALLLILIIIDSCTTASNPAQPGKIYFDLPGYFDEQVSQLFKDSFIVIKTSEINGNTDQHEMEWTDWKKELALYYASDINKTSFIGKYEVDTAATDSSHFMVTYKATDPSLRTSLVEVTYQKDADSVSLIHISNQSGNFLISNKEELYYEPFTGYIIKSSQQMKFFGENNFAIKGDILKKQQHFF